MGILQRKIRKSREFRECEKKRSELILQICHIGERRAEQCEVLALREFIERERNEERS